MSRRGGWLPWSLLAVAGAVAAISGWRLVRPPPPVVVIDHEGPWVEGHIVVGIIGLGVAAYLILLAGRIHVWQERRDRGGR